jgi:hypothetical protein
MVKLMAAIRSVSVTYQNKLTWLNLEKEEKRDQSMV